MGRTTNKTTQRKEYIAQDAVLRELEEKLDQKEHPGIDYITFSGSGEPTLNLKLGYMIKRIKKITPIQVAVLTNGTLLYDARVREDISQADLVIPSLDAPQEKTFKKINRPHSSLRFEKVVSGIADFSQNFQGKIWLEIMLVEGINNSLYQLRELARVVEKMRLEKIQLNTPVRPPAEDFVRCVKLGPLRKAKSILGKRCEIIARFKKHQQKAYGKDIEDVMLTMIKRRPVSLEDISSSLGVHRNEAVKYLQALERENLITSRLYGTKRYYYSR